MQEKIILKRHTQVADETMAAALIEVAFEHFKNLSRTLTKIKSITGYTHDAMLDELKHIQNAEQRIEGCSDIWEGVNIEFPYLESIPYNKQK